MDPHKARMMRWLTPWLAFAALCALLPMSPAHAQRRPKEGKQQDKSGTEGAAYRALIDEALSEFDRGNWNEALAMFQRAHALEPNARTLRGIGFCLFEIRRYVDAAQHLELAMSDARSPLTASQRSSTQQVLDRARAFVAHVQVRLNPASARLLVDGQEADSTEGALALDPGEHELSASADGYAARTLHVSVQSGPNDAIALDLSPLAVAEPTPVAAPTEVPARDPTAPSERRAHLKRGLMIGGFAVAGAGLVSGAVTGLMALMGKKQLDKHCAGNVCPADQSDELDRANGLALGSSISFGVAALGLGVGLTGLLLPGADKRASALHRIELVAGARSLGLVGTF